MGNALGSGLGSGLGSVLGSVLENVERDFRAILTVHGMHKALSMLNERTRYRFTGVYRVDPPALRNQHLFDRENPALALGGDVSDLKNTYCGIVAANRDAFAAGNSRTDARLTRHPARESVVSYIGVPIMCSTGVVIGTLCHFDLRPRILKLDELSVLEAIAPCISEWLT